MLTENFKMRTRVNLTAWIIFDTGRRSPEYRGVGEVVIDRTGVRLDLVDRFSWVMTECERTKYFYIEIDNNLGSAYFKLDYMVVPGDEIVMTAEGVSLNNGYGSKSDSNKTH